MSKIYDFSVKNIEGKETNLKEHEGKVMVIVNVASKCGFTPQYKGLEELYEKYKDKGLVVLGFPCNQFGKQEPGDENEIKNFCSLTYDVKFPLYAKVDVNGDNAHPLFEHLKKEEPGIFGTEMIKWNFTKFLVDRKGSVVKRVAPKTDPLEMEKDIEGLLK